MNDVTIQACNASSKENHITLRAITRTVIVLAALAIVVACEEGPGTADKRSGDQHTVEPATALTNSIEFPGAVVKSGRPPSATNNPGDPVLSGAPEVPSYIEPGQTGVMEIEVANLPADEPFEVNVRFDSTDQYISVPMSAIRGGSSDGERQTVFGSLARSVDNTTGTATVRLPFSLPDSTCDNVDAVVQQIQCYESVNVGGVRISDEQARALVLNCTGQDLVGDALICKRASEMLATRNLRELFNYFRAQYERLVAGTTDPFAAQWEAFEEQWIQLLSTASAEAQAQAHAAVLSGVRSYWEQHCRPPD